MREEFILYIHFPYCLHKCPYCDFNSYAVSTIPEKNYTSALLSELDYWAVSPEWKGRRLSSIYFGGGTPSLLKPESVGRMISFCRSAFQLSADAEITLEANPGTVTTESLSAFCSAGVNRLSIGAQSFKPEFLSLLGRIHSNEQTEMAVAAARVAGVKNLGLDLIYALPGQTGADLEADLQSLVRLDPQHVSAYTLTIEKGTPFSRAQKRGLLQPPADEEVADMMQYVQKFLEMRGWHHYEISNYALSGRQSRHNLGYWSGIDYLGIGSAAHSFLKCQDENGRRISAERWANQKKPEKYINQAVAHGHAESSKENLSQNDLIFEFFFLGLRKIAGVDLGEFENLFACSVDSLYGETLRSLQSQGLAQVQAGRLCLTSQGLMLADSVISSFLTGA